MASADGGYETNQKWTVVLETYCLQLSRANGLAEENCDQLEGCCFEILRPDGAGTLDSWTR